MSRIIEAKAVISAEDRTGKAFDAINKRFAEMGKAGKAAKEVGKLGKELYQRLAVMGGHVAKLGRNLDTAMTAYNQFVGSLESQVLTSAKRFETLNIDPGAKTIETLPVGEQAARPLTKLMSTVDPAGTS